MVAPEPGVPGGRLVGWIKEEGGTWIREIPPEPDCPEPDQFPLHVAALDHGSVGAAGSCFIEYCPDEDVQYLHWTSFDKYHHCVRDGRNGINKSGKFQEHNIIPFVFRIISSKSAFLLGLRT